VLIVGEFTSSVRKVVVSRTDFADIVREGLCLVGFVENVGARYFGVFLAFLGGLANPPCIVAWQANNIRGQWKRALSAAVMASGSALGGLIG
jgi:hypothetical protein